MRELPAVATAQLMIRSHWCSAPCVTFLPLHARRKLELALGELVRSVPRQEVNGVLSTLETILRNALEKPEDERFRQLRCSNRLFLSRVGRHICAVQVLQAAGFRYLPPVGGGGTSGAQIRPLAIDNISQLIMSPGGQEGLFCLMRDDPGLLWLTLSAVREASEQQRTAC